MVAQNNLVLIVVLIVCSFICEKTVRWLWCWCVVHHSVCVQCCHVLYWTGTWLPGPPQSTSSLLYWCWWKWLPNCEGSQEQSKEI